MSISVLLVDDHLIVRSALREALAGHDDIEIVGEAGDLSEMMALAEETSPDVISLDLLLPDGNALDSIGELRSVCPHAKILVLTGTDDPALMQQVISAGADGYIVKIVDMREVILAIRSVSRGLAVSICSKRSLHPVIPKMKSGTNRLSELSLREREVLGHVARGYTSQEIAEKLFLSAKTIETYRSRLTKKLGIDSRAELVQCAIDFGCLAQEAEAVEESA